MGRTLMMGGSALVLAAALLGPSAALAADDEVSEVVVTGSYIRGTPEDASLPVNVLTSEDLSKQGAPSNVDLVKALPMVGATIAGDANPLGSSRVEGASSINLRGLTNARTLVLFNGRRMPAMTSGTQSQMVDINTLPMSAVGRIEVLKDGGAATYGSDAIAGVVNIITKKNFQGLEVGGSYSYVDGTDGDISTRATWGWVGDRANVLLAASYNHRSELQLVDRDWATRPYLENPGSWSTASNPGIYSIGSAVAGAATFLDPGCTLLGGELTPLAVQGTARNCLTPSTWIQNLVDEQHNWQVFGEVNYDVTDNIEFHLDAYYSETHVPDAATATSISPTVFPTATARPAGTGVIPGRFYIPAGNPGLVDFLNRYNATALGITQAQYDFARANGVNAAANWRPVGQGGNPAFGGRNVVNTRDYQTYRVSGGFSGKLPWADGINWDANLTAGSAKTDSPGVDNIVNRLQYALRGLGGIGCTPGGANAATSTPGVGPCRYYNPFSPAQATNALTGAPNPSFNGNANAPDLVDWFMGANRGIITNSIVVGELVLDGELPFFELPGGKIGWAGGFQYRLIDVQVEADDLSNFRLNPCTDEGAPLSACAAAPTGILSIFGPVTPRDYNQEVKGFFGELSVPLLDSVQVQLAVRHEIHDAGETTNPKIAIRWQALDWLAFRASAGSTYRAPPLSSLDNTFFGTVSQQVGTIRIPIDNTGNPNLKPETADNYNFGIIIGAGPFKATLDYWKYQVKDLLSAENGPALVNALIPTTGPNRCNDPAFADLKARFTFNASGCGLVTDILRVKALASNGAGIETSGLDGSAEYRWDDVWGGQLTIGGDFTYTFEYLVAASTQFGITLVPAFDAVGKFNSGLREQLSMPQWRAQAFLDYSKGPHNFRYQVRHADGVFDQRAGNGTANDITAQIAGFPTGTRVLTGVNIGSWTQHDFHYRVELPHETTATFSVINIFNPDPSMARNEYSYDTFTATPLGRVFKVGVNKKF